MQHTQAIDSFRPHIANIVTIALIMALRVFGLFMVVPVLAGYASNLDGAQPTLIGMAVGVYGLSQALLQIPFGMLSDNFGRKKLIAVGLLIFITGSFICAISDSIYSLILGRFCQGAGAIGAVIIALIADLTPKHHLAKAMAVLGASMGMAFVFSFLAGSIIHQSFNVPGIFNLSVLLGFCGLLILFCIVPSAPMRDDRPRAKLIEVPRLLFNKKLFSLNFSIFLQHAFLIANFVIIPHVLSSKLNLSNTEVYPLYFAVVCGSFLIAVPLIRIAENNAWITRLMKIGIGFTCFGQFLLYFLVEYYIGFVISFFIYFIGFNVLEASLPSSVSKLAPEHCRGTAVGIYSTCQFLGIFVGGLFGGFMFGCPNPPYLFLAIACVGTLWFLQFSKTNLEI